MYDPFTPSYYPHHTFLAAMQQERLRRNPE
jgi:hypothetical protein